MAKDSIFFDTRSIHYIMLSGVKNGKKRYFVAIHFRP